MGDRWLKREQSLVILTSMKDYLNVSILKKLEDPILVFEHILTFLSAGTVVILLCANQIIELNAQFVLKFKQNIKSRV